nr:hypothetical protein [uncultured Porphyromonas sp.]
MGQIQYTFNPTGGYEELDKLFFLLNKYFPEIPEDPRTIGNIATAPKLLVKHGVPEGDNVERRTCLEELLEEQKLIIQEKEKVVASLKDRICILENQLSQHEFVNEADTLENRFFNISDHDLVETLDNTAPFAGEVGVNGEVSYCFNESKGEHFRFSKDPSLLLPFCEIIDNAEDANQVRTVHDGSGVLEMGKLRVINKVQISLVRV